MRCILCGVLAWLPVALLLIDLSIFILITPLVLTLSYSFLFLLINNIMKKPFDDLIQMFNEKNASAEPKNTAEDAEEPAQITE